MPGWKEAFRRLPAERVQPSAVSRGWGLASAALTKAALGIARGVLVKCYPQASAPAAGLVNRITKVILLDGDLLGAEPEEIAAEPDREQREALMVVLGVLFHECGHVNHSPEPHEYEPVPKELVAEVKLLEEGRMEARANESHPRCTPYLRAAIANVLLEHEPGDPDVPMSRAAAVRQAALLLSRVPAGTLLGAEVAAAEADFAEILGASDLATVKEIVAEVCEASDEEAVPALIEGARRLLELAPPEDLEPEEDGSARGSGSGAGPSWGDVHKHVEEEAGRSRQRSYEVDEREGGVDPELRELARALAGGAAEERDGAGLYGGHGFGFGPGIPTSGGRAPVAIEVVAAHRLATALRAARSKRLVHEGRIAPPGRFSGRGAMRQASELERGAPVRGLAFRAKRTVVEELWQPQVGICVDVSGSMGPYEGAIASVLWVTHTAVEEIGGRAAVALFGDEAELLCPPARRLTRVPVVSAVGGAEDVGEAIELVRGVLPLSDPRRPRLLVLVGDGAWVSRPWLEAGERNIAELRANGCAVVSVGIEGEPVPHGEDKGVAVGHSLEIAAVIGRACVGALTAR
jgi:hypothetical protein